ncbi:type I phosphodiesterase/nucleotide pyrophosphatase [Mangrovibacterium diazotrophicum]|uniref:Type I phosphodiesterase/nucleotide pyrophosphatase n=2 Tax=Mangrovibacterium diazotrophicum TaxID=1261403 RepID=A0A419VYG4_9BACT|nr:type I phosphodiesterase/nucleotide pyrophosphatase [Mangrovibacterium diazotrophicum]
MSFAILTHQASVVTAADTKILVVGVDGIINTAIDYASTPGIDKLIDNASYNMAGYGGLPAYSTSGWATMLTGVQSDKHGVTSADSFTGNQFDTYPSVVSRIKSLSSATVIASVVRDADINTELNADADYKFNYASDDEVLQKSLELLGQSDLDVEFVQFSGPQDAGAEVGYQLRKAQYVLAVQQIDDYIQQLQAAIESRDSYADESWAIFLVSTHGGTESGVATNNSLEEMNVPIILSGSDLDNKKLDAASMDAIANADNILKLNKGTSYTYVRVPIDGTALQGMDKFTIELWIKANTDNSSDPSIIGDKDWDSGGNPGFTICRSGTSWKINIANTKRERYDIGSGKSIEDETWHHLAVSFDKTNECNVYQDGELMTSSKLTYKATDDMTSPYNYICLAQDGTETYGGGSPNWSGSFNEVRIWTDVLSQETIQEYMYLRNIESSDHPNLASLDLYLKLDEVRGTTITDYSGNGHDGELVGSATERHPYYPVKLTDVSVNVLSLLGLSIDSSWGLEGNALKSNVPYRLFKVN